jgi:hypothetical protein
MRDKNKRNWFEVKKNRIRDNNEWVSSKRNVKIEEIDDHKIELRKKW